MELNDTKIVFAIVDIENILNKTLESNSTDHDTITNIISEKIDEIYNNFLTFFDMYGFRMVNIVYNSSSDKEYLSIRQDNPTDNMSGNIIHGSVNKIDLYSEGNTYIACAIDSFKGINSHKNNGISIYTLGENKDDNSQNGTAHINEYIINFLEKICLLYYDNKDNVDNMNTTIIIYAYKGMTNISYESLLHNSTMAQLMYVNEKAMLANELIGQFSDYFRSNINYNAIIKKTYFSRESGVDNIMKQINNMCTSLFVYNELDVEDETYDVKSVQRVDIYITPDLDDDQNEEDDHPNIYSHLIIKYVINLDENSTHATVAIVYNEGDKKATPSCIYNQVAFPSKIDIELERALDAIADRLDCDIEDIHFKFSIKFTSYPIDLDLSFLIDEGYAVKEENLNEIFSTEGSIDMSSMSGISGTTEIPQWPTRKK